MTNRKRRHVWEIIPLMIIFLAAVLYTAFVVVDYGSLEQKLPRLKGWEVNGQIWEARPFEELQSAGPTLLMRHTLDASFEESQALCFYSTFQNVRVRLDGAEIYRFDKPRGERMMQAAPSYWNQLNLPEGSAGRMLEIELHTPYQQYERAIPEIRHGSAEQIERYVALRSVSRLVLALAVLFVGLIFAIVAVVLRYYVPGNTGLYTLSLFTIVLAIFLVAQQTTLLLELYDGISYIALQSVAFLLCPVLYSRYLTRIHSGKTRRFARMLYLLSIANTLVILALQILGLRDMPQMLSTTRNICAVIIAFELWLEIRSKHRVLVCAIALLLIYAVFLYYFTDTITWLAYVGIFGYLYILLYRVISSVVQGQAKQIRLEAALEVSRSEIATIQITSHFFYHTLDSIRALIRLDADKAYKMTGDFAKYIRHRVDGVEHMQETVPFSRELRSIRAYTDIKQAQLGKRFEMIYDVEGEDFEILPLTVQPLVENAVIHAVQRRREGGVVRLACRETKAGYHIEVIDNGPGPQNSVEASLDQKESTAIRNVNTRLEYFGIAPLRFEKNELGGMTVSLDTPKKIVRKGNEA